MGNGKYRLFGAKGGGSMIVEAAIVRAQLPVEYVDLQWDDIGWDSRTLATLNPLGQVPTLELPDGTVMTESAAMILHFAERAPAARLVPPTTHPAHVAFLRWLVFLVAAVYPTFTYGDDPKRWLDGDEETAKKLRASTDEHRKKLWRYVEGQIPGPWFLGDTWSALELYVWQMSLWRPGREWFKTECPKLHAIGVAMHVDPTCKAVATRNGY